MQTLMIKDLSASLELDRKAMTAVRGGLGDQANGTSQSNVQNMAAAANVGNGSMFGGPTTIQSDNTFTQSAYNESYAANFKGISIGFPLLRAIEL
jgi:predicted phage gp36 major capsid-like protein